jgi:hypothetical protein
MAKQQDRLDPGELRAVTDRILRSVTSPQFLAQLKVVEDAPAEERLVRASERLSPDALRGAGVDIPETVRISTRYFEQGVEVPIELADTAAGENIVRALNRARPGLLDDLKVREPRLFERLVGGPNELQVDNNWSICLCVGSFVCVGVGGGSVVAAEEAVAVRRGS